jgi:hypothetical protein
MEATSEIRILGNPQIRALPNIITLEGICWNVLAEGDAVSVLVFDKTDLGNLSGFMLKSWYEDRTMDLRLKLACNIVRGLLGLQSCRMYLCHTDENALILHRYHTRRRQA